MGAARLVDEVVVSDMFTIVIVREVAPSSGQPLFSGGHPQWAFATLGFQIVAAALLDGPGVVQTETRLWLLPLHAA
jgi:hypothetical protein